MKRRCWARWNFPTKAKTLAVIDLISTTKVERSTPKGKGKSGKGVFRLKAFKITGTIVLYV
ncbi:hypothetical protein [Ruminococcus albus]|uniref:hypothetical protein n=1 Tax=Ruminococcus albus TaxID=1264 RepID=UPI001FA6AC0E|nr:hypothetical protein [Ruminococcus albus]